MKKKTLFLIYFLLALILASNLWVILSGMDSVYENSSNLEKAPVGLVFGTSRYQKEGGVNPFFEHRIQAAYQLLKSGKVDKLLVSGSKDSIYYNEAKAMKAALLELGVDESRIWLDAKGDRTIDSIKRMIEIHEINRCILVTQKYHAFRAVFIAKKLGIDAQCYVARSPDFISHLPAIIREVFARPKAILDLYL